MKPFLFAALLAGVVALSPLYGRDQPKAQVIFASRPMKPAEAIRLRLAGSGVFLLKLDIKTGKVTSIKVVKSTGHEVLDRSAIQALHNWRYAPGTVREVRRPIRFPASDVGATWLSKTQEANGFLLRSGPNQAMRLTATALKTWLIVHC